MFCKQCGKEVKDGTKFCSYCGAQIGQTSGGSAKGQSGAMPSVSMDYLPQRSDSVKGSKGKAKSTAIGQKGQIKFLVVGIAAVAILVLLFFVGKWFIENSKKDGKQADIPGMWIWEVNVMKFLQEIGNIEEGEFSDLHSSACFEVFIEFESDGTWESYVDKNDLNKALMDWEKESLYYIAAEQGEVSEDIVEDMWEDLLEDLQSSEVWNEAIKRRAGLFEMSGDYEYDKKTGEINLDVDRAGGEKISGEVSMTYKIKDGELEFELDKDKDNIMDWWDAFGFFDTELYSANQDSR